MKLRRLIIVGASGVIGGALLNLARATGISAIGTALTRAREDLITFDMRTTPLRAVVPDIGPDDVVFLLAGYISPAWIFANPADARHLNLDRSKDIADEVASAGARLVFMSTDQVFDGETGGYTETSTTGPLNLYGRLKAEMEGYVLAAKNSIVARTGWNVGWQPDQHCAVSQCYETLLKPGARMAHDNFFNLTDVDDTARGLLALATSGSPTHRIYHLVSASETSRIELARMIKAESLWGPLMNFETVPFASIPYSEPRPARAFLRSENLASLNVSFAAPRDIIRRKVALLDRWRIEAGADVPTLAPVTPRKNEFFPKHRSSDTMP
jgi:dTDP-4-dehydrorhamnose reductase